MSRFVKAIQNVLRFHKKKIGLFFVFFIIFLVYLFPYNDLGDLVTSKVSQYTHNGVYLQFSDLNPSLFPSLGFEFKNVSIDTPILQSIKADSLTVRPAILSLLTLKPGLSMSADGLFKGKAHLSGAIPGLSPEASMKPKISGDVSNMDLADVTKAFKLPMDLSGKFSMETDSIAMDLNNWQQLTGDISANIKDAKIGAMNINTPLGPLPLPSMNFSIIDLKADAKDGTVKVQKLALGKTGDELSGTAKGQFEYRNEMMLGTYDFSIEIEVLASFETKMGVLWSTLEGFIESFKRSSPPGKKTFAFRISGQGVIAPPRIGPYQ